MCIQERFLEARDPLGCDTSREPGDAPEPGEIEIRGNVRERIQNEVALRYPGVRQHEIGVRAPLTRIGKEIEIDHPRTPALVPDRAAERRLEGAQLREER